MTRSMAEPGAASIAIGAPDGLTLHARCYGTSQGDALPVICLPGLTRTAADFDELAGVLAGDAERPRRVIALDYRGRGRSDYDRDPDNYNPLVELADVLAVVTALEAMPAIYVGTSRGGIIAMLLAAARPTAIAGVVLNDIGPVIEPKGLMRIKGYTGKLPQPASYDDAALILRRLFDAQFPNLTEADWRRNAERTFRLEDGALVPSYDARLARTLTAVTPDKQPPPLWLQFDAMAKLPVLVIHGALSDILSAETVEAMRLRHPALDVHEIADQGHAPLLSDAATIAAIAGFVRRCDAARH